MRLIQNCISSNSSLVATKRYILFTDSNRQAFWNFKTSAHISYFKLPDFSWQDRKARCSVSDLETLVPSWSRRTRVRRETVAAPLFEVKPLVTVNFVFQIKGDVVRIT